MTEMPNSSIEGFCARILKERQGGGGVIKPLNVIANGKYSAADYGCDGFDPVNINVPNNGGTLSLEGINSLKTLATMTVGDFVYEFKEPKIFYDGSVGWYSDNGDEIKKYWINSAVINNSLAVVSNQVTATERHIRFYDTALPPNAASEFETCSNFSITKIEPYIPSYEVTEFTSVTVSGKYTKTHGYDETLIGNDSWTYKISIEPASFYPKFTNLSDSDYREFYVAYCKAANTYTPVIKIF